jgi:hypothetical protein
MKTKILLFILPAILFAASSCKKDPILNVDTNSISFEAAGGEQSISIRSNTEWQIIKTDEQNWYEISQLSGEGDATITITAYKYDGVAGRSSSITISGSGLMQNIALVQNAPAEINLTSKLLISEIFFSSTLLPDGKNTCGDKYIKITNNTDGTVYIDGLLFVFSATNSTYPTTGARWIYPELPTQIGVNTIYQFPGSGNENPVEKGASIVLAVDAQDYSANGGCNLSIADFEFNDVNDIYPDTENPDVPDMLLWFKSSATITTLHNRGFESYALVKVPEGMTKETYMAEYPWIAKRRFVWEERNMDMERDILDSYLIPNEWVIDGVNLSVEEVLGALPWNSTIDAGYTNVSKIDNDSERYGKAVARKKGSGVPCQDTDNSTNDFEIITPSLK